MVVWVSRKADCERRMGVIATKRTFKNAVDRNRAKRLIRESFRLLQDKFSKEPWDMVILARRRILSMKQQDVQREMRSICRRHGIYSDTIS
jgi:ribonuclease P protein component